MVGLAFPPNGFAMSVNFQLATTKTSFPHKCLGAFNIADSEQSSTFLYFIEAWIWRKALSHNTDTPLNKRQMNTKINKNLDAAEPRFLKWKLQTPCLLWVTNICLEKANKITILCRTIRKRQTLFFSRITRRNIREYYNNWIDQQ